jgi:hypothetical protein
MNSAMHFLDESMKKFKGELILDDSTRVIVVDQVSNGCFKFCVSTSQGLLEFAVNDVDERNMWIQKLVYIAEKKSELGSYIMHVDSDADYKNTRVWENKIVAHSVDKSSGVLKFPLSNDLSVAENQKSPPSTSSVSLSRALVPLPDSAFYASFLPFEDWQACFEPEVLAA